VHARRPFFIMADVAANARRKAQGKTTSVISPLALEAVRRIDALFEIKRSINGQNAERRQAVRAELSAPLVADRERWMREQRAKLSRGNDLASQRSRVTTISPRRWITCSSAGWPSPASSMTDGSASRTMRRNERCAASRSAENHGCSRVPTAVFDFGEGNDLRADPQSC
jgi:Transposase IS66 family